MKTNNLNIQTGNPVDVENQRKLLLQFVKKQLVDGVDFGIIPGTNKPTLFKPGAEKLAKLFQLGSKIKDKTREINPKDKFAYFTYTIEISHLPTEKILSECEGSANSFEKKYLSRSLGDVLNTLQKMAQKRAYVGAIIQAVGASDIYTQDMDSTFVPHAEREADNRSYYQSEPGTPRKKAEVPPDYRIPFGKYKGKGLEEVGAEKITLYYEYLLEKAAGDGKSRYEMGAAAQEFMEKVDEYLKLIQAQENEALE